ncbi:4-phosphopantoate--beta-alanine ligase, partial [Citrobacter freundii]|uniref:4-phosphopantoate--beta-alanine ligase n=1 Tax=Citrobacter freundii TaxID=546 RepID=UPI0021C70B47
PTQFGPGEDFDNYPRTLEQDSRLLADVGCDIIFAPSVEQMYGTQPRLTNISVSQITDALCGSSRPGHFDGVALVVTNLFNIVQPNYAFFGQKDYQQLDVIGVPIVRAADGLALSSRNGYLSAEHRQVAPVIYQSLKHAEQQLHQGKDLQQVIEDIKTQLTDNGFVVDYVEARQT